MLSFKSLEGLEPFVCATCGKQTLLVLLWKLWGCSVQVLNPLHTNGTERWQQLSIPLFSHVSLKQEAEQVGNGLGEGILIQEVSEDFCSVCRAIQWCTSLSLSGFNCRSKKYRCYYWATCFHQFFGWSVEMLLFSRNLSKCWSELQFLHHLYFRELQEGYFSVSWDF